MKYLLDTHIILWVLANDKNLTDDVKRIIDDRNSEIYYSTISPWEVEIKRLKRKDFKLSGDQLTFLCDQNGLNSIQIKNNHVSELKNIKIKEDINHNDPFDKMLLAQAMSENMILVTHDRKFSAYDSKNILLV